MASAGSCSTGFRSRPSAGAGSRRSNGFEVASVNSRKPKLTKPSTPMTRLAKLAGRLRLNIATASVHSREDPGPQQQRTFVRAPQRGHAIERGQRRVGIAGDVQHREIESDEGVHQRADGRADQHELPGHRRPAPPPSSAHRRVRAPTDAEERLRAPRAAARGSGRNVRARESSGSRDGTFGRRRIVLERLAPLPAACISRRAWRGFHRRRTCRPACGRARPRPAPRGTGPAGCPSISPAPCV